MTISPSVITSKAAQNDLNKIKMAHGELVTGMASQTAKVIGAQQLKMADMQAQETNRMQMDKEKAIANTAAQKDALTFAQKQQELDIKKAALTQI